MTASADHPPRFIARQLALGFGSVSVVAILMCVGLLSIISDVSGLVSGMREDEHTIHDGLNLATAVREVSLHIAHTVIEANDSHLEHYEQWRQQVAHRAQQLRGRVRSEESWRVDELLQLAEQMNSLLHSEALPATRAGDAKRARGIHRQLEALGAQASEHADILAHSATSSMAQAHTVAKAATRLGLIGGGLCAALIVALSFGFTWRLRAVVLVPLVALTDAARRFGRGDFDFRVGAIGKGELAAVSTAFDSMAEELARREARLLQNERMAAIGQLAAGIAHELNNPIGIIRGYLKTMSPDSDVNTLSEELAILDEEAAHCQRIAEDLLSYASSTELSLEHVELSLLLEGTARRFGESAIGADVRLQVDAEPARAEVDRRRLRQVILNLVVNAAQVSPPNASVEVRGRRSGARYVIDVRDHGQGVAAEDRDRIFEPFFSKRRGGSGLGLAVCSGIVKAHDGTIVVDDAPSGGAVFRVSLPLRQTTAQESKP